MKTSRLLVIFLMISFFNSGAVNASEHHSGHGGGAKSGGGVSAGSCGKPHLANLQPPHLATVAPAPNFPLWLSMSTSRSKISVTVKNFLLKSLPNLKTLFYLIKGKLPASLVNTAARIKH